MKHMIITGVVAMGLALSSAAIAQTKSKSSIGIENQGSASAPQRKQQ